MYPDAILDQLPPPRWTLTYDLTIREISLLGRAADVFDQAREELMGFAGDRTPIEDAASAWGSEYAPYGSWTRGWQGGGRERLVATLSDRIGGDAGWVAVYDDPNLGDLSDVSAALCELRPGWVGLRVSASWHGARQRDAPAGLVDGMEDLVVRLAGTLKATYGAALPGAVQHRTHLESKLRIDFDASLENSANTLRGYSWTTYLPPGVIDRLGGTDEVMGWHGFDRLREVDGGGVLVRATALYDDYDHAATRRVFDAVKNVLPPPGAPDRPKFIPDNRRYDLVWADEL